ncbi:MAG: universal stress protein [Actinomycetes bacterium]
MTNQAGPIVIAFDGSPSAIEAVERAAGLLGEGSRAIILTVWEPGLLNAAVAPLPGGLGAPVPPPDVEQVEELNKAESDHADRIAKEGVELAQSHGLVAEPVIARDESSVAATILRIAEENEASAIVIGSRRHSAIAAVLLGSTTQAVLHKTTRPLLVMRPAATDS